MRELHISLGTAAADQLEQTAEGRRLTVRVISEFCLLLEVDQKVISDQSLEDRGFGEAGMEQALMP